MAVIFGSARIDERGKARGGKAGDQTGKEVSTQSYYMSSKGWYCLRPKSAAHANAIAAAMKQACLNPNIGYDQYQRDTLLTQFKKVGSISKVKVKCETDCSALVRVCILQAAGRDVGNIRTATMKGILEKSGLFEKAFVVKNSSQLYTGDILVTKTTGHTVVVVSGKARGVVNKVKAVAKKVTTSTPAITKSATVLAYQKAYNISYNGKLQEDGKKGPKTKATFKVALLKKSIKHKAAIVKFVQKQVGAKPDGEFGPDTEKKVKAWQKKNGLTADGVVYEKTWNKMVK